jgi:hypothetical protein
MRRNATGSVSAITRGAQDARAISERLLASVLLALHVRGLLGVRGFLPLLPLSRSLPTGHDAEARAE